MSPHHRARTRAFVGAAMPLLAALLTAMPAHALYKVVGPDGKVTYTDRPPVSTDNKVQSVNANGSVTNDVALPYELRQAAQRYPVTLYVTGECTPCDAGRQMLRERGVPFSEKMVSNAEDNAALQNIVGSASLPALTVGGQVIRGWERSQWTSYLDAAGYPKESKLPPNFPVGTAEPLTSRRESTPAPAASRAATPAPTPAPAAPSGIRF